MRRKKQIYFLTFALLSLLSFFLYSCIDDEADLRNVKNIDEAARLKEISEARAFFENHVASIPLDAKPQGMYPGNFATDWDNATYVENTADSIISVNACIVPEYYYEGDFAKDYTRTPETDEDWYHTVISQKVISLKDMRNGARCCYIITLIPDASCATQSRAEIDWLFNNGESNGEFSGVVVYSTLEENRAMVVGRYQKGKRIARASVFEKNSINEMNVLLGYFAISQKKPIRTKQYTGFMEDGWESNTTGWTSTGGGNNNNNNNNNNSYSDPFGGASQPNTYDNQGNCNNCDPIHDPYIDPNPSGNTGTVGGGSAPTPTPDPPKPPETPESVAPNATKILKNANMTIANWKKLEAMILKIKNNCLGGKLYSELVTELHGNKVSIEFIAGNNSKFDNVDFKISLSMNMESNALLHELFHAYQTTKESQTSFENSIINQEFEALYAQYLYVKKLPEYKKKGNKWASWYTDTKIGLAVQKLEDHINPNSTFKTPEGSLDIYIFTVLKPGLASGGYIEGILRPFDYNRNAYDNFKNLKKIAGGC